MNFFLVVTGKTIIFIGAKLWTGPPGTATWGADEFALSEILKSDNPLLLINKGKTSEFDRETIIF